MNMDANFLNNGMETLNNISKLAANVSAKTQNKQAQPEKKDENMNQPHNQTVEVKVGETGDIRKPLILKEKTEQHIHKVFPDNRELNDRECEIEKLRLTQEHELKMKELEFRMKQEEQLRAERKEREEYARQEAARRREADRKFARRIGIGLGCAAVVGLGLAAYDIYSGNRRAANNRVALGQPAGISLTAEEGSVQ